VIAAAMKEEKVAGYLEGKTVVKSFVVQKRLVSLVIK